MSFDRFSNCTRSADYTKPTSTAPRVWQVEAELTVLSAAGVPDLARTLAAEVDARDEVITKLLAMLKTTHSKARYTDLRIRQLYEQAREIAGRTE